MASTFADSIHLTPLPTDPTTFETTNPPESNTGAASSPNQIAYGGTTLAIGVKAAHATVGAQFDMYSATGYFFGPTLTTAPLRAHVTRLRDTRAFATRQISIAQAQPQPQAEGTKERIVLHMVVDFHAREAHSLLDYAAAPAHVYSPVEASYTTAQIKEHALRAQARIPRALERVFDAGFVSMRRYFDARAAPEGIGAQTLAGFLAHLPTTQDSLPMTEKTTANYFRARHGLGEAGNHMAALAYILDAGSSALPPVFARVNMADVAAAATLDFAIRVFRPEVDMQQWHLREDKTVQASHGRSYQEARMWDPQGRMVASMTQQCILRGRGKQAKM